MAKKYKIPRTTGLYTKKTKAGHGIYFSDGTLFSARKFPKRMDAQEYLRKIKRLGKK